MSVDSSRLADEAGTEVLLSREERIMMSSISSAGRTFCVCSVGRDLVSRFELEGRGERSREVRAVRRR